MGLIFMGLIFMGLIFMGLIFMGLIFGKSGHHKHLHVCKPSYVHIGELRSCFKI
jgi:hypothetical protein